MMIDPWAAVDPVWRPCFELAWESFQAGSLAVGAVLVDAGGGIVSAGRNRRNEPPKVVGQVGGSSISHAEINAVAMLPVGDYSDHVLYSTLEPCLLCMGALRLSHVGTVRFFADDPMWYGMERVPELNRHLARRWPKREGPLDGPLRTWAEAITVMSYVERGIDVMIEAYGQVRPDVLGVATRLAARANQLRRMHLDEALSDVWTGLAI